MIMMRILTVSPMNIMFLVNEISLKCYSVAHIAFLLQLKNRGMCNGNTNPVRFISLCYIWNQKWVKITANTLVMAKFSGINADLFCLLFQIRQVI